MKVLAVILSLFTTAQVCVGQDAVKTINDVFRIKLIGECASLNKCMTSNSKGNRATFEDCDDGEELQQFRMSPNGQLLVADKVKRKWRCAKEKKGVVVLAKCKKDPEAPFTIGYNKKTIWMHNSIHRTVILAGEQSVYDPNYTDETDVVRFYSAMTAKSCSNNFNNKILLWNYMQAADLTADYNNEMEIEYLCLDGNKYYYDKGAKVVTETCEDLADPVKFNEEKKATRCNQSPGDFGDVAQEICPKTCGICV